MSFTAEAEQERHALGTVALMNALPLSVPDDVVPRLASHAFGLARRAAGVRLARLETDAGDPPVDPPPEMQPRVVMKPNAGPLPASNDTGRGNPFIGLRPTFESRLSEPEGLDAFRSAELLSGDDYLAFDGFEQDVKGAPAPDAIGALEPPDSDGSSAASHASGASGASGSEPSLRSGSSDLQTLDGATPAVGTASALASSTPAPADATPIEIAAPTGAPVETAVVAPPPATGGVSRAVRDDRPNYAALINPGHEQTEERCLAEAIYFEARSEPAAGQAAVAQVVLNRVASGLYPSTVCGVVFQNRWRRNACQFSFACDGHPLRINEAEPWARAVEIARAVSQGSTYIAAVGDATHYHANYVRPRWARFLKRTDRIGHHIFYELRPGQT